MISGADLNYPFSVFIKGKMLFLLYKQFYQQRRNQERIGCEEENKDSRVILAGYHAYGIYHLLHAGPQGRGFLCHSPLSYGVIGSVTCRITFRIFSPDADDGGLHHRIHMDNSEELPQKDGILSMHAENCDSRCMDFYLGLSRMVPELLPVTCHDKDRGLLRSL